MTCIVIASWMLAVVGAAVFVPSFITMVHAFKNILITSDIIAFLSVVGSILGGFVLFTGIAPYLQYLPCITIIP